MRIKENKGLVLRTRWVKILGWAMKWRVSHHCTQCTYIQILNKVRQEMDFVDSACYTYLLGEAS